MNGYNEVSLSSPELEKAVLGGLLISPENITLTSLMPRDFYIVRHRWLLQAILQLHEERTSVDVITITNQLDKMGKLQEFGGPTYLAELMSDVPFSYSIPDYAKELQDLTRRRKVVEVANELAKIAYNTSEPMENKQAAVLDDLFRNNSGYNGAVHIGQWADEAYAAILDNMENGQAPVLKTGFLDLDFAMGGMDSNEGTMVLLTGEPGQGKTILMSDMAFNMQKQEPGAIYSLEMKRKRMMYRAFSAMTDISAWEMRSGHLSQEAFSELGKRLRDFHNMQLYVSDHSEMDTIALQADLARLKYEYGIKWYCLDYMTLLTDGEGTGKDWERAAMLSKRLLRINRRLGLSSIVIHTLNKTGDVAGEMGAQYDADVILKLVKPKEGQNQPPQGMEARSLEIKKNRDGELPLGTLPLLKHAQKPKFENAIQKHETLNGYQNGKVNGKVHA